MQLSGRALPKNRPSSHPTSQAPITMTVKEQEGKKEVRTRPPKSGDRTKSHSQPKLPKTQVKPRAPSTFENISKCALKDKEQERIELPLQCIFHNGILHSY